MQFGTSRFLQAHVDLFVSEALARDEAIGRITVVQSSGDAGRASRLKALAEPSGFPVCIQGLKDGQKVEREFRVTSVSRALSTANDWEDVTGIFTREVEIVLSNTADSGFAPSPADQNPSFDQAMSYPAKLMHLLWARFRVDPKPLQIMPMELIADNGAVLKKRVLELAQPFDPAFTAYLSNNVRWVNSLVDRIVSEPIEPAGAIAEPYALWAIEDQPGLTLPCQHPGIKVVKSLADIEAMKLFVLNLGHTFLAQRWLDEGSPPDATVLTAMSNDSTKQSLSDVYEQEVKPVFVTAGLSEEIGPYIETTLERFANPFLKHRLSDIAQNHKHKIERRIGAFLDWARARGDSGDKPVLTALVGR